MTRLLLILLLLPLTGHAHPGIGIVKDSRGHIYYTDLQQVWQISKGRKQIVVPDVHTHELAIDRHDRLYGEDLWNDDQDRFFHYQWVRHPDGRLDTVTGASRAYVRDDYSLARDLDGNTYFLRQFSAKRDTSHIYKKSPDGRETVMATGAFGGISWLHPQADGSLLYVQRNAVYRVTQNGQVTLLARDLGHAKPSFSFAKGTIVYGAWQDGTGNVYVAVFSDQTVRRIAPDGAVTDYYQSKGPWAPLMGVFGDEGQLWLLESSDKNEMRVTEVPPLHRKATPESPARKEDVPVWLMGVLAVIAAGAGFLVFRLIRKSR